MDGLFVDLCPKTFKFPCKHSFQSESLKFDTIASHCLYFIIIQFLKWKRNVVSCIEPICSIQTIRNLEDWLRMFALIPISHQFLDSKKVNRTNMAACRLFALHKQNSQIWRLCTSKQKSIEKTQFPLNFRIPLKLLLVTAHLFVWSINGPMQITKDESINKHAFQICWKTKANYSFVPFLWV